MCLFINQFITIQTSVLLINDFRFPFSFIQFLGDFLHSAPIDYALRLHVNQGGEAWQFVFNAVDSSKLGPLQVNAAPATTTQYGATHQEDMFYMMPIEFSLNNQNTDQQVANMYTRNIINFVKKPSNVGPNYANIPWQAYTQTQPVYATFTRTQFIPPQVSYPGIGVPGSGSGGATSDRNWMRYRGEYMDFLNDLVYDLQKKTSHCRKAAHFYH